MRDREETMRANKAAVARFNKEVIERGDEAAFRELMAADFINRSAAPGTSSGPDQMLFTFNRILRPSLPDLTVEIHEQLAESDKVMTRKTLRGTHRGELFGISPTGRHVEIDVIDIVRLRDCQYVEHWGINTLRNVLAHLGGGERAIGGY